jgi:hypothetical protein
MECAERQIAARSCKSSESLWIEATRRRNMNVAEITKKKSASLTTTIKMESVSVVAKEKRDTGHTEKVVQIDN